MKEKLGKKKMNYKPLTMAQGGGKPSYFVPKGVPNWLAFLYLIFFYCIFGLLPTSCCEFVYKPTTKIVRLGSSFKFLQFLFRLPQLSLGQGCVARLL
jgi:hypothetical protein